MCVSVRSSTRSGSFHVEKLASQYGYNFEKFAVAPPGVEQKSVWLRVGRQMKPYVADTVAIVNSALKQGKRLIFEGAQGTSVISESLDKVGYKMPKRP